MAIKKPLQIDVSLKKGRKSHFFPKKKKTGNIPIKV